MSWTGFNFDVNSPFMNATLNTSTLMYMDAITTVSITGVYDTDCSSDGNDCSGCHGVTYAPIFCPADHSDELNVFQQFVCPKQTSGQLTCDTFPYSGTYVRCANQLIKNCGNFDNISTCTLGKHGYGYCGTGPMGPMMTGPGGTYLPLISLNTTPTPIQNVNWGTTNFGSNDPYTGFATCIYNYDYTGYNYSDNPNGPANMTKWLVDVCSKTNNSAPKGMDPSYSSRIRDSNIIYACIIDYYNQLYNTGYYTTTNISNPFQSYDFFSHGFSRLFSNITQELLDPGSDVQSLYPPNGEMPASLKNYIQQLCSNPVISQNEDVYTITFNLSYPQAVDLLSNPNWVGYMQNILTTFFRDSGGTLTNRKNGTYSVPPDPSINSVSVGEVTCIQLTDSFNNSDYSIINNVPWEIWNNVKNPYTNCLFGYLSVNCTISSFSPLLLVYAQMFSNVGFSQAVCTTLKELPNSTIPVICYNNDKVNSTTWKNNINTYCSLRYIPPGYTNRVTMEKFLIVDNFSDCMCYTSTLPPVSDQAPGNPGAMCFDNNCNDGMRNLMGVQDCYNYCTEVKEWIENEGENKSANANELDHDRFLNICGYDITPYQDGKINTSILAFGAMLTVLMPMLIFSGGMHSSFSALKITILILISVLVLGGLTVFFTIDMAGKGECNGNSFSCQSKITKLPLPSYFCELQLDCECALDSDCPLGCICQSSMCTPSTGSRPVKIIQEKNVNVPVVVLSVLVAILVFFSLLYLHDDYHWKIGKGKFGIILFVLCFIPVFVVLYKNLKKVPKQVFAKACKGCMSTCGVNQQCGVDNCGDNCGSCVSSQLTCNNNSTCQPTSDLCDMDNNLPSVNSMINANYGGICGSCSGCVLRNPMTENNVSLPISGVVYCQDCEGGKGNPTSVGWTLGKAVQNNAGELGINQENSCNAGNLTMCACVTDDDCVALGVNGTCVFNGSIGTCSGEGVREN